MEATGLPRGTAYPAMRRLSIADATQRPLRKYYKLTRSGEVVLEASRKRYPSPVV
jgi:PadR family transcriptional regulator, regulatory protein PadR